MQAYVWGTRGSLPVAPDGVAIREKIRRALLKANGRRFDNAGAAEQFIDAELDFPVRSASGGDSSCMEIIGGDYYTCCDMGSGLRCLGQQVMRKHGTGQPQIYNFFMSHVDWDAYGVPVLSARLHPRQCLPHSRRASRCRARRSV